MAWIKPSKKDMAVTFSYSTQPQPTANDPTHPTAGQAGHQAAHTTPRQQNQPRVTLATTRGPHTHTRRGHTRPNQCGQQRNSPQADRVWLRRRRKNTTHRLHPGRSTTNPASDMPATTRPRPRRLTRTGCADLRRKDQNEPRTPQRWQQQNRPNDEQANHEAAITTMHQPNHCSSNDATINRPHASRPTPNPQGMQGSKQERSPADWRHHGAPRPPTTIPTDTTRHPNSTIIPLTSLRQRTTSNPRPRGRTCFFKSPHAY